MYELKKNGKVFTSKFVGPPGPRLIKKNYLPGRGLTKVGKHWLSRSNCCQNVRTDIVNCPQNVTHFCCCSVVYFLKKNIV
jgi:hypothetical protein